LSLHRNIKSVRIFCKTAAELRGKRQNVGYRASEFSGKCTGDGSGAIRRIWAARPHYRVDRLISRAPAVRERAFSDHLQRFVFPRRRSIQPGSDCCHGGRRTPWMLASRLLSNRELDGRRAGVGYSEVEIGDTRADGPPAAAEAAKIAFANSAQLVSPLLVM
jgi:hypothetical protein